MLSKGVVSVTWRGTTGTKMDDGWFEFELYVVLEEIFQPHVFTSFSTISCFGFNSKFSLSKSKHTDQFWSGRCLFVLLCGCIAYDVWYYTQIITNQFACMIVIIDGLVNYFPKQSYALLWLAQSIQSSVRLFSEYCPTYSVFAFFFCFD